MKQFDEDQIEFMRRLLKVGDMPNADMLGISGVRISTIVRRGLAEWIRPRGPGSSGIGLRLTYAGREFLTQIPVATPAPLRAR